MVWRSRAYWTEFDACPTELCGASLPGGAGGGSTGWHHLLLHHRGGLSLQSPLMLCLPILSKMPWRHDPFESIHHCAGERAPTSQTTPFPLPRVSAFLSDTRSTNCKTLPLSTKQPAKKSRHPRTLSPHCETSSKVVLMLTLCGVILCVCVVRLGAPRASGEQATAT